jgi:hypothetical protein
VTICSGGGSDCLTGCHQHNSIPATYKRAPRPRVAPVAAPAPGTTLPATTAGVRPIHREGPFGGLGALAGVAVDHNALGARPCQSCHNGALAIGVGASHPRTTASCGACHSTVAWSPVLRVDHADVLGTCVTCHSGSAAASKPVTHIQSGSDCDRCHTTSAWKPAAFDHGAVIAGSCATCHSGVRAPGRPARHVLTVESCDACHYVLGWVPVKPPTPPARRLAPSPRGPVVPRVRMTGALLH